MPMISVEAKTTRLISPTIKRSLLAFLVAPLAGPLGIYCGTVLLSPSLNVQSLASGLLFFYIFATPFVYFFSILLGAPFYLLLRYFHAISRNRLIFGWTLIGVVSVMILITGPTFHNGQDLSMILPFGLGGAGVGFVFWRILSRRRRDQAA